jgi:hypothetical protein
MMELLATMAKRIAELQRAVEILDARLNTLAVHCGATFTEK